MQRHCSIDHKETGVFLANEQKTKWVTLITFLTMIVEIVVGYWSGSMALLADGWHMASHTLALSLSVIVYFLYRHPRFRSSFTFGGGKILSLGGYTSAILLVFIAGSMIVESLTRFYEKPAIHYSEALIVATLGLLVNLICAWILHNGEGESVHSHHHGHNNDHTHCSHQPVKLTPLHTHHHGKDHNHESAYVHILTDALTSLFAIVALVLGAWQGWSWADPAVGVLGGLVVLKWSLGLIRQSGMDLLDAHDESIDHSSLITTVEKDGSKVLDIHLWKLSPGQIACELVVKRNQNQHSSDYRDLIQKNFSIHHLIIEVV